MDASAFKQRFLCHSQTMYWAALRLTRRSEEAEDLVQDAMLKLWTARDALPEMASTEAYCVATVRNAYLDHRRRRRVALAEAGENGAGIEPKAADDVERNVEDRENASRALRAIGHLPPRQRQIMLRKDVDGDSYDEIAAQTGLTQTNIRVILSRARKAVRQMMGNGY